MIITLGEERENLEKKMNNSIIVGDADALIALAFEGDILYSRAITISQKIDESNAQVIFPNTAISEAITTLLRKHSNPKLAGYLAQQYRENIFRVEYVDEGIMRLAVELFNPESSKQNTFFDALVAATAKKLDSETIFSFDRWYKKLGFNLAADLK